MTVRVIKNEAEYEAASQRIYELINANQKPILPGSSEADEMELLSILVEKYEREHYPIEAPDPIEAIKFRMEQMNLKQKDIAPLIGGKTRVSEVLSKKRPLSLKMIILLNRYLGIPLESLVTGNKSVKLKPEEKKMVLSVPSIGEYVKSTQGKKTLA
ncbi:MAG TPA: helix-turn-helix domain-containing protein [Bacteroides sp.]|nr:helix-turn-helix domain-containing protein [Bacteroides sp.]